MSQTKLYKLSKDLISGEVTKVIKKGDPTPDGSGRFWTVIPFKDGNADYQKYLEWVDAGNTPEAAD
jgi:hypothetical protein